MGAVADALGGAGGGSFASDDDPELVRDAIPFGLKLYETLLESTPEHRGLLVATARGFASYAYLLQDDASRLEAKRPRRRSRAAPAREPPLPARSRLRVARSRSGAPRLSRGVRRATRAAALARTDRDDVSLLYWVAAGQAGALSADKGDAELIADLPRAGACMERVLDLDEGYDAGAAHEFFVSYEASRPGGSVARAREHFARADALAQGERASVYVSLAESVSVQEQNLAEFQSLLDKTLAVDVERAPQNRLVNVLSQRRAQWLRAHVARSLSRCGTPPEALLDLAESDRGGSASFSRGLAASPASAQVIKLGTIAPDGSPWLDAIHTMAEAVEGGDGRQDRVQASTRAASSATIPTWCASCASASCRPPPRRTPASTTSRTRCRRCRCR